MASKGATGKGAVLSIGSEVAGGTWTPVVIGQVKNPMLSGQKWAYDKITNLASPVAGAGILDEEIPSVMSAGELTFDYIWLPADPGQLALVAAFQSGLLRDFQLQLPIVPTQTTTGNLYAFEAYVSDLPAPQVSFDKTITAKCTLKLNTLLTITLGS